MCNFQDFTTMQYVRYVFPYMMDEKLNKSLGMSWEKILLQRNRQNISENILSHLILVAKNSSGDKKCVIKT